MKTRLFATLALAAPAALADNMDSPHQVYRNPPPVPGLRTPPAPPAPGSPHTSTISSLAHPADPAAAGPLTAELPPVPPPAAEDAPGRFTFDLRGFYGIGSGSDDYYATDLYGGEAELAYYVTPHQAVTFSISFGSGGSDTVNVIETPQGRLPVSDDYNRSDWTLMAGYRVTFELGRRTTLSLGIKGGLDIQGLSFDDYERKQHETGRWEYDPDDGDYDWVEDDCRYSESSVGFAYAASLMLETRLTERLSLLYGYQFKGSTTEPDAPSIVPGGQPVKAGGQNWHEIHFGLRARF